MKSIKVSIFGKQYPLRVEDSEEETMRRIAQFVDDKFTSYKRELSKQPESTVMVLAALSIAEELFEERERSRQLEKEQDLILEDVNKSIASFLEQIRT